MGVGEAVGLDMSAGMLSRVPEGAWLVQADARCLPFAPDAFDAVYCALSWQLLPDPVRLLERLRTVCRPGAVLTCSLLGRSRHSWHFVSAVLRDYLGTRKPPFVATLEEAGRRPIGQVLAEVGWRVHDRSELTKTVEFATADQWLTWQLAQVGRGYFDAVPVASQPAMYERLRVAAERVRTGRGLCLEQQVVFLSAKPE
jgi:ubiquinone/menaquinone biosynthesis C-methylase UbiE